MALRTPKADVILRDSADIRGSSAQIGADAAWGAEIVLPGARFATDATYLQQGDDLVLVGTDGATFVVRGYFLLDTPPDLTTPEGARITPALVDSFTPPEATGQYAQAGQVAQTAEPIGQVKDLTGKAFAVRTDGTRAPLSAGDPVYQGDVIETADGGAINMVFVDQTTFALGGDARLALDELVYNPATQTGSSSFSIMKGVFVFVSGEIAKTDNTKMQVNTPVATIGIRGTKVAGEIKPAGEESKFTVIDGEIAVATQAGTVVMGDQNATTTVTSFNAVPTAPVVLSQTEVNQSYGDVRAVSGGILSRGGQSEAAPDAPPSAPTGEQNPDGGAEAEAEAGAEGEAGAEDEAAGEGGSEGEGEGAADAEGAAADAEGASAEGEAGDPEGAGPRGPGDGAPEGEGPEGRRDGEQLAEGEGPDGPNGPASEADAEGAGGEGPGEDIRNAEAENGEGAFGEAGPPDGPDGSDPNQDGPQGPAGNDDFSLGGAGFGGGPLGGPGDGFAGLGGGFGSGLGGTGDPFGPGGLFGGPGDFLGSGPLGGFSPPPDGPPDDPFEEEVFVLDAPVVDDRSTLSAPQFIIGGNNTDTLTGGTGDDDIFGFQGDDTLSGNAGNDTLTGGDGDDIVNGDAGNDVLIAGTGFGFDTYDGGAGTDTLSFSSTFAGITVDLAAGTAFGVEIDTDTITNIEVLIGGSGDDILDGDGGINEIFGGAGNDIIDGFGGVDTIHGGAGDDTIGFDISAETIDGGAGTDRIQLFGAGQAVNAGNLVNVSAIEEIDLGGTVGVGNTLTVNSGLIATLTGSGALSAFGDGNDVVVSTENWNLTGPATSGVGILDSFSGGGATLNLSVSEFQSSGDITFDAGAVLNNNIVNQGTLSTADGTYTNDGQITLTGAGDIDLSGSKVLAGTGTFLNQQSLSLQDDTITATFDGGNGTIGVEGTITVDGQLILGATTTLVGGVLTKIDGTGTLLNQANLLIEDGSTLSVDTIENQGSLAFHTLTANLTSATIDNAAGGTLSFFADTNIDMIAGQTLTNDGLVQFSANADLNFQDGLFANSGTIDVVAAASTLVVTNGEASILAGGAVTGAGTLQLNASNFNVDTGVGFTLGVGGAGVDLEILNGNITGGGTFVNESELAIDGAGVVSVATFTNSIGGVLDHADGILSVTSAFENQSGGTVVVDTTVASTSIDFANDFTNNGLITFVGGNSGAISVGSGSGTLTNAATGTIQVLEGLNVLDGEMVNSSGGLLEVSADNSTLTQLDHFSAFTNDGIIRLTTGTLVTDTAFLNQGSGFTLTNTGTLTLEGGVANATMEFNGDMDNQGLLKISTPGTAIISTVDGADGTILNSGTLEINNNRTLDLGQDDAAGDTHFTNTGTMTVDGDLILHQTTLTQNGFLQMDATSLIKVQDGSVFNLNNDFALTTGRLLTLGSGATTGELGGTGTLTNASVVALNNGTLSGVMDSATGIFSLEGSSNLNTGQMNFNADNTLFFTGGADRLASSGSITINGGSTLTVDTGTLENLAGGTITGFGVGSTIVTASGGVFANNGSATFGLSPGSLTVAGNVIHGDTASMEFELGGLVPGVGGFDQFTVTGEFAAGGALDIVEFGTFDVSVGDSFAIVNAGTLTGSFREFTGLDVGGGVVLDATQSASGVVLTGRAVTHQGTASDDTLTGGAGDDVIVGGDGADVIIGNGGADLMHGGDGDDIFIAADTGFGRLDGEGGFDTVRFDSGGFDLTVLRGDQLSGIERFDITGTGDNTLTLDVEMALNATSGTNALTNLADSLLIDGNAGDVFNAQGAWSNTGTVTIDGNGYSVFENNANDVTVFVDTDVAVNVI